ncbi:MAG: DUF3237 domain-containing protein [Thermoplasmata archaeon]|nr:DUF3237 domain-containing protein [Thermoplasmata archaeon]
MRLEPLCELDAAYRDSSFGEKFVLVRPYGNEGGAAYGELDGTVRGEKLRGALRLANHPRRRSDGAMLPDAHGLIKTHDDALVLVSMQGRTVFTDAGGRQLLSVLLETEDERYKWLNNTVCVLEGTFDPKTMSMRANIYACVSDLP